MPKHRNQSSNPSMHKHNHNHVELATKVYWEISRAYNGQDTERKRPLTTGLCLRTIAQTLEDLNPQRLVTKRLFQLNQCIIAGSPTDTHTQCTNDVTVSHLHN